MARGSTERTKFGSFLEDYLYESKRPLILAGNGIRQAGCVEVFNDLLKKWQCPVLTTWRAADIIDSKYRLNFGRPGIIGQRAANFILQGCDFLMCLGARLDLPQVGFGYENFAPNATKYVCDVDTAELNKLPHGYLLGSWYIENFLPEIYKYNQQELEIDDWRQKCQGLYDKFNMRRELYNARCFLGRRCDLYDKLYDISLLCKDTTVVLGSSGSIAEAFFQIAHFPRGIRVINTPGLGSMGFALPAAIGAYYATGKPIVCIDGDGSFAMNMQELEVVSQQRLPIAIFIINNHGYVSIQNTQNNLGMVQCGSTSLTGLHLPNYRKVATAFDIEYCKIQPHQSINNIARDRPIIYEIDLPAGHTTICRTKTQKQPDGTLKASRLENLWPFLPEEVIEEAIC